MKLLNLSFLNVVFAEKSECNQEALLQWRKAMSVYEKSFQGMVFYICHFKPQLVQKQIYGTYNVLIVEFYLTKNIQDDLPLVTSENPSMIIKSNFTGFRGFFTFISLI